MKELTENERAVLDHIRGYGSEACDIIVEGLATRSRAAALSHLEKRGLVEREPNPWGPETPWWWCRLPAAPDGFTPGFDIEKGMIFDRYEPNNRPRTFIELTGKINEFGCAEAYLRAGEHGQRTTWVPRHLLEDFLYWTLRGPRNVTAWSSKFSCPIHGECSEEMVTTKKTCSLCDTGLIRW